MRENKLQNYREIKRGGMKLMGFSLGSQHGPKGSDSVSSAVCDSDLQVT